LKRGSIVNSIKGSQGGYQLTRAPKQISVYDILSSVETSLFENAEDTVKDKAPEIETTLRQIIYTPLDGSIKETLENISLYDLVTEAEKHATDQGFMFFI
jgi:Rrf2 family protein